MKRKKVFVSGCFDLLHSGHVRFLEQAAAYGQVYVGLGSDQNVAALKGRPPVNRQEERQYLLQSLRSVKRALINTGSGKLDFLNELHRVQPHVFVVNRDGHSPAKAALCRRLRIRYVVLEREPAPSLPARSTTALRQLCRIPFRLDLAGGWLDQPYVSRLAHGPVLTISIQPDPRFNERSGLASSSRKRAIDLWETAIPPGPLEKLAKMVFAYENPPGTERFSGSQDAIGVVFPGLNRLDYAGGFWPRKITSVHDDPILTWLEHHIRLVSLGPRRGSFDVLRRRRITRPNARALAQAADAAWHAILQMDLPAFGRFCRQSFEAQAALFPGMLNPQVRAAIQRHAHLAHGWKLSGAGGGGYLVLVTDRDIPGAIKLAIRRKDG